MNYRPDIDGLRMLAVVSVVMYHAGAAGFDGGYVGVDVFFIISGFLITKIIYGEIVQGRFSILKFYERRARRILPALFVVILFCFSVGYVVFTPEEMISFALSVIGSIFFIQNILLEAQAGYFDLASETKPLLHVWSLAVEEQFYILFPPALVILMWWLPRTALPFIVFGVLFLSLCIACYLVVRSPVFTFYMLPTRVWELLCGALLAIIPNAVPLRLTLLRHIISVAGVGAIIGSVVFYSSNTPFPGYMALPPVLGTVALICSGTDSIVGRVLSWRPFVFIGLISYSLYLWHWPLFAFHALIFPDETSAIHSMLLVFSSVLFAILSWRYVERPFRRKGGVLSDQKTVFITSALIATVFSVVGVLIVYGSGWPWRTNEQVVAMANVAYQKSISDGQCRPKEVLFTLRGRERGFCQLGVLDAEPDIIIWGDSHVGAWYPLLDEGLRRSGQSALAITTAGCPVAFGIDRSNTGKNGCKEAANAVLEQIENGRFQKVLIVGSWFGALRSKDTIYNGIESYDDETRLSNVVQAITETGDRLRELNMTSGFLMTVPGARHSVPEAMFRQARLGYYPEVRRSKEEYEAIMQPVKEAAEAHFDHVLQTDDFLCASGFCEVMKDGRLLYYDSNHPSLYLNEIMLPHLQEQINDFAGQ